MNNDGKSPSDQEPISPGTKESAPIQAALPDSQKDHTDPVTREPVAEGAGEVTVEAALAAATIPFHPLASIFPMLDDESVRAHAREIGLLPPASRSR
jgi:hypothetical protein